MTPTDPPLDRYARVGLWALPVWALALFLGTLTHQPPPQTDLAGWSRYVTTTEFLLSHLFASILGGAFGILGMIALAVVLVSRGSVRLGIWALVTGVVASTLLTAVFGIAAWAQPAIGRLYLAGRHAEASALYYDAAQSTTLVVTALVAVVLLTTSVILFGVAVARSGWLPRWAGVGFAVAGPLFAIVGFILDNFVQSIASGLMVACSVWIAVVAWQGVERPAVSPGVPSEPT